jgi:hypothetical protein
MPRELNNSKRRKSIARGRRDRHGRAAGHFESDAAGVDEAAASAGRNRRLRIQ